MTEVNPLPRQLSARDVLRIPDYRRLWLGQLVSEAGDGLTNLTLLLLVNHLTGSTAALAAMAIVLAVPPLTIGLVAGAYVDRADRRRIMLASDLLRAITVLGFVLVGSADQLWLLFLLAFAQATVGTFFTPARGAVVPRIVPPEGLLAANSVAQATKVVSSILGAGLGGVVIGLVGVYWPAFVLDGLSFLVSFAFIVRLPAAIGHVAPAVAGTAAGLAGSLVDGLRTVARSRRLSTTILALSVCMLGLGATNVLFVPLLVRVLAVSTAWFGPVELAQSASMMLAAGLVGVLAARLRPTTLVTGGLAGVGIIIALLAGVTEIWHVLALMFAAGWFVAPAQAAIVTVLQQSVADAERGRIMSVLQAAMSASSVLSMAFAGIAGDVVGVRNVFLIAGAIVTIGSVVAFFGYRGTTATVAAEPGGVPSAPAAAPASTSDVRDRHTPNVSAG
jgi:MFS family permease